MLPPLADPRPFADVLRDWMARAGLNTYSAPERLDVGRSSLNAWLTGGAPPGHERAIRALMTLIDEGRA